MLQSLDNDGDLNNTITIDDEVTPNLKSDINLSNITEDELAQVLEDAGIAQIVPKKKALDIYKLTHTNIEKVENQNQRIIMLLSKMITTVALSLKTI